MRDTIWMALLVSLLGGCAAPAQPSEEGAAIVAVTVKRSPATIELAPAPESDCNIFRLAIGKSFCRPIEELPLRPPYCTRSLAGVDCWRAINPFGAYQREVADGPWSLTPAQQHDAGVQ